MSTTNSEVRGSAPITTGRLLQGALIGIVVALVLNLLLYFLVPAIFGYTLEAPLGGPGSEIGPLPVYMVVVATVVPAIVAALLMMLLNRLVARPVRLFRIIAGVVLLLSLAGPLPLPIALGARLTLVAMHVITAAAITYGLTVWARGA